MAAVRNSDPCCSATSICNHPDGRPLGLPCCFPKSAWAEADILQIISWESWHSYHIIIPESAVRAELHLLSSVCCTIDSPAKCLLEKTPPLASVQTAHLFLEMTTKDTKCPRGLYRSGSAGERGPWLLGFIIRILCEGEDLFQLHSDSSSHQPLRACLHLQRSLIKNLKAQVQSED